MKNMKKNLMNGMVKSISRVALKTGESATERECVGFVYEPKVPNALLMEKAKQK